MGSVRRRASGWWGYLVILPLAVLLAGCSGNTTFDQTADSLNAQDAGAVNVEGTGTPGGLSFPRSASLAIDDLLALEPRLAGAGFLDELPVQRALRVGEGVQLTPVDTGGPPADGAAFCCWRLRCYHAAEAAGLSVELAEDIPEGATCYLGWANHTDRQWEWSLLPVDGTVVVDPAAFSTVDHYGYAAVLVLGGGTPVEVTAVEVAASPDGVDGYTLYTPLYGTSTYLVDSAGEVVREWPDDLEPSCSVYLLDGFKLLRPVRTGTNPVKGTGAGGGIKRWDASGELEWFVDIGTMGISQHHDIEPLPNGNVLVLAWDLRNKAQSIAAGRNPNVLTNIGMVFDCIYEIAPSGKTTAEVVWEWHLSDHLVQDFDPGVDNYGDIVGSPGLLDINFSDEITPDFSHGNAVDYNAELDQIILNLRSTCEFYIIDHSTTSTEAAGHTGGNQGRGGDFLYRWGNPAVWGAGTAEDQQLYYQHDTKWIPADCPGAGHLLMFNNGENGTGNRYSRVVEIIPPLQPGGSYAMDGGVYGPAAPCWEYAYTPRNMLYSQFMSGAQRLVDGNTLLCSAEQAWFLEVTGSGEVVWEYRNHFPGTGLASVFRAERYELFTPWLELLAAEDGE